LIRAAVFPVGGIGLWVKVDQRHGFPGTGGGNCKADCGGCLSAPTLLADDCNGVHKAPFYGFRGEMVNRTTISPFHHTVNGWLCQGSKKGRPTHFLEVQFYFRGGWTIIAGVKMQTSVWTTANHSDIVYI
jgi:hypothetical protein